MRRSVTALAAFTACGLVSTGSAWAEQIDLTMWVNGACAEGTCIERALVDKFEAANPDIKIKIVPQPGTGYFQALLGGSLTGTGPDLAQVWPGGYMLPFTQYMTDIHGFVSPEIVASSSGADYFAENNDSKGVTYAAPLGNEWYTGFYNKRIFAENGFTPPKTWEELREVSKALKAKGVLPIVNGSTGGLAQFSPGFEWAYLVAALPLQDWTKLIEGTMPYSQPALEKQLENWASLFADGYLNEDAFNNPNALVDFTDGKAAMILTGGSWLIPDIEKKMTDDFGILIPPYSDTPQRAIVSTAGKGYAVLKYSKHAEEASKFVAFMLSDEGQTAIATLGAPTRAGFPTQSPSTNELIAMTASAEGSTYPMFDNFVQPAVMDAISKNVGLVLIGKMSPKDALAAVDAAFAALPDDQRNIKVPFGNK